MFMYGFEKGGMGYANDNINKIISFFHVNPQRPNSVQKEKINLYFYFHTSLWCLKRFYEGLHKTFWGTTKKCKNKNLT